jgi:hypothetical protein
MRQAYIASYPLSADSDDLDEVIIARDEYWSDRLNSLWDELASKRQPSEPMLQGWYYDDYQTQLMAWTNQPFSLS